MEMHRSSQEKAGNISPVHVHFYTLVPSLGEAAQSASNNPSSTVTTPRAGDRSVTVSPLQLGKSRHDTPPFSFSVGLRKSLGARPGRAPSLLRVAVSNPALRAAGEQRDPPQPRIRRRPAAPARSPSREGPAGPGLPVPPPRPLPVPSPGPRRAGGPPPRAPPGGAGRCGPGGRREGRRRCRR